MNHPTFHGLTWFGRLDVTDGDFLALIVSSQSVGMRPPGGRVELPRFIEKLPLIETGDLVFLTQKPLQIPQLTEKLADLMDEAGLTLADLLRSFRSFSQRHSVVG